MLILSRKKEEVIIINDKIRIKVVDIGSDVVKIGIDAPNYVKIYREEIWKSIQEENVFAASKDGVPTESIESINKQLAKHISKESQGKTKLTKNQAEVKENTDPATI